MTQPLFVAEDFQEPLELNAFYWRQVAEGIAAIANAKAATLQAENERLRVFEEFYFFMRNNHGHKNNPGSPAMSCLSGYGANEEPRRPGGQMPGVDKECEGPGATHHFACQCREEYFSKIEEAFIKIREFTGPPKMSETMTTAFVRLREIRLLTDAILPVEGK